MTFGPELIAIVAILFAGALTRSTFGFGEALVAMPLLSMAIDVKSAAALVAFTSVFNAVLILSTGWKSVHWGEAVKLLLSAIVGIPCGVYLLVHAPEDWVKLFLAGLVISFSLYHLVRPAIGHIQSDWPAVLFGFAAGVLGGAYNTLGAPLVMFATLRGWPVSQFRSTLQAVFLPTSLTILIGHAWMGLWTPLVLGGFACSLPFLVLAGILGSIFSRRLRGQQFTRAVFILLLVIGGVLLVSSAVGLRKSFSAAAVSATSVSSFPAICPNLSERDRSFFLHARVRFGR